MTAQPVPSTDSLVDWLRSRSDPELAELFRRRPDLALPAPADLPTLAARVSVRTSVQRAVDALDARLLATLEALVLTAEGSDELSQLLDDPDPGAAVDRLRALALVWGPDDDLRLVPTVRDALGAYPAGLGRPAALLLPGSPAAALADPARLRALLATADDEEREILDRLAAGPPLGRLRDAWPDEGPTPAPRRLVSRGLLAALDARTVELPREVGLALRGPHPLGAITAGPPAIDLVHREPADLDSTGSTAVLEFVRLVDALADGWTEHPPPQLRSGGVGVRELRRTARELRSDETAVAVLAEVAAAAGLLNSTHAMEPVYLPTPEFDTWRRRPPAGRWADLATAWLAMTRQPDLISQRGERDRLITALGPDAERGTMPALRRQVLDVLLDLPPGAAPSGRDTVLDRLAWQAPRRAAAQRPLWAAILDEADLLGLTAAGGPTGYSRTLLAGSRAVAEQVLASAIPPPVDYFLVQPDLTVVVPGPPTADLAAELGLLAELESTGGASVYRVTEATIRRALDAGRSGTAVAALIEQRSRTPVPQALQYLVDDLARRHGALRTGSASAYLRCDDQALLTRVAGDRDVAELQLHRIAPTVAVSGAPISRVLDVLRAAGYAPAAEDADGTVIALGAEPPRSPSRQPARPVRTTSATDGARLTELVQRVRSGDTLTTMSRRTVAPTVQVPGVTSAATMGTLRSAIREGRQVLLGLADADGSTARHVLEPISMAGGFVRGHEPGADGLRSFPLHRITGVTVVAEPDGG